jgi:large subunit ribosomal protein L3
MKFILGTKEEMMQVFDESGNVLPVTLVKAGPVIVTAVREPDKDGYRAIQVGFGERKPKNINKAQKGQFEDLGNFRYIREFRTEEEGAPTYQRGDKIDVSLFEGGEKLSISAISKGKGFQGVVKRHGFAGGRRSHGQKHSEREAGSIGATGPQRVFKGTRMAGRMGGDRVTVKNLKLVGIDKDNGYLLIKGAVPGRRGTLIEIRTV